MSSPDSRASSPTRYDGSPTVAGAHLSWGDAPGKKANKGDVEKQLEPALTRCQSSRNELGPVTTRVTIVAEDEDSRAAIQEKMRLAEGENDIQLKTLSWQKTTAILFAEYICLAILSFAWSFYFLGYAAGLIINAGLGLLTWYCSYTLWQYCMLYPGTRDITDIAYVLFGNSTVAREIAGIGLTLNNVFVLGLHVLTGSQILNKDTEHGMCTVGFVLIFLVVCITASLPRTLNSISLMSVVSAIFMGLSIFLTMVFAGIQEHPVTGPGGDWPEAGPVTSSALPPKGITFVKAMNAVLNLAFTWGGLLCYPSFIAEMKEPKDFPKALRLLTIGEMVVFSLFAVVGYRYLGQYSGAPAAKVLMGNYAKIAFSMALVPTVVIGVIYGNVVQKYLFNRVLGDSKHAHSNTVLGWGVWVLIDVLTWTLGMIIAQVVPSFSDLLGLMSALFASFFAWIFWAVAYYRMNRNNLWDTPKRKALTCLNVGILAIGLILLGPGIYASGTAIYHAYQESTAQPFSCADNSSA